MVHIGQTELSRFRTGFAGQILVPGDAPYLEAAGLYNRMIEDRPALIAQCGEVQDVVRAVNFGRDLGLEIAVRGGGHAPAGFATADDGLVIDLRRMNAVSVDPGQRTGGGCGAPPHAQRGGAGGAPGGATPGARA